jgi:PTH2 family peptidyl-tRNA hydrolase
MSVKQVIVMRKDLNMRKGKMIAQGCHASMKVFFDRCSRSVIEGFLDISLCTSPDDPQKYRYSFNATEDEKDWISGIFTKICVSVDSEEELLQVYNKALELNLPASLIEDCGLTEFKGVPTKTCCAIGPAKSEEIDKVTGGLKLY